MNLKVVRLLLLLALTCTAIVATAAVFPDMCVSDGAGKNGISTMMISGEDWHPVLLGDPVDGGHPSKNSQAGNLTG